MFKFIDNIEKPKLLANTKSFRIIKHAEFLENVDEFLAKPEFNNNFESALRNLTGCFSEYGDQIVGLQLLKSQIESKTKEAKINLKMVEYFIEKNGAVEDQVTQFQVVDHVYMKCALEEPVKNVVILLGANVMLEYPLDEAKEFLTKVITDDTIECFKVDHDLDYIKDQISTTELNISQLYNHGIDKKLFALNHVQFPTEPATETTE